MFSVAQAPAAVFFRNTEPSARFERVPLLERATHTAVRFARRIEPPLLHERKSAFHQCCLCERTDKPDAQSHQGYRTTQSSYASSIPEQGKASKALRDDQPIHPPVGSAKDDMHCQGSSNKAHRHRQMPWRVHAPALP